MWLLRLGWLRRKLLLGASDPRIADVLYGSEFWRAAGIVRIEFPARLPSFFFGGTMSSGRASGLRPIAAITHNLLRAADTLAGRRHARVRAATIRRGLVAVAGPHCRTARHGRGRLTLHLPEGWHREQEWLNPWEAACGPPAAAA
jgi:hypothetical protein